MKKKAVERVSLDSTAARIKRSPVMNLVLLQKSGKDVNRRDPMAASGTPQCRLLAGSPAYCSPEQYDGRPEDGRTDIWSYGVTLFEILTGNRPGLGPAAPIAVRRYMASHPDSTIPPEIWQFLLRLLAPDPARRPESFAQVGSQLREIYAAATGRSYARQFPQPTELGDERTSVPGSRSRTALA